MKFVLGVDGGGTGCRAALATLSGEIVGQGLSGASNIRTDAGRAYENIVEAARQAFASAGEEPSLLTQTGAVLGLAGANVGDYARRLEARLPFARSHVVSDALIALEGAVGDAGDGAIAILGTGTAYLARRGGETRLLGGWGFQIGDQGSGARIGRDLLEAVLLAHDGLRPASPLSDDVLASFGNEPDRIVEFALAATPRDFGALAPKVLEYQEDDIARDILGRAVAAVEASLGALRMEPGMPLSLLGGLAPFYAGRLLPPLAAFVRPPARDALGGAVLMATRLFAGRSG